MRLSSTEIVLASTSMMTATPAAIATTMTKPAANLLASPGRTGIWVFLASDLMGFAGLLAAYAASRARSVAWPSPAERLDQALALAMTLVLVASSATMSAASTRRRGDDVDESQRGPRPPVEEQKRGQGLRHEQRRRQRWLLTTAALGLTFLAGQAWEFRSLTVESRVPLDLDLASAFFFVLTGYHGLHVLLGVFVLLSLAWRERSSASPNPNPAQADVHSRDLAGTFALYWQFVDLVWLVIFAVLYLAPVGAARG